MKKSITCDIVCVHEDKVNKALDFLKIEKSQRLLNIFQKICDEKN